MSRKLDTFQNQDFCSCGKRSQHSIIDQETNDVIAEYCEECFIDYLKDRYAKGLPVAPGWVKFLELNKNGAQV